MKWAPISVVALLVLAALGAATQKWMRPRGAIRPLTAHVVPAAPGAASALHGLGMGPPSEGAIGSTGAPMLHEDARHTHRAAGQAPRALPSIVWQRDMGGPVEAQVTASPDERVLYVASLGGAVTALAREDGVPRWTVPLGDRVYATPSVGRDGTIYVGSDARKFVAITPEGRVKWSLDTEGEADTGAVFAPDGTVVFAAGRTVYGVGIGGQVRWRFAARRKVFTSPAVAPSGRVYFGSQDHRAYALTDQGALSWSTDLGADVDGAPAIGDDGSVYVGTDGDEIVRLDPERGTVVWRTKVRGFVRGALSIARNGDVVAGVYGPTPREVRARAADGEVIGQLGIQGTGAREFGVHGGALEDDTGTLVFGTQDDDVYAVDAEGTLLWRFTTGGDVDAPVTLLGDGSLVVGSDDGNVYLLRAR